MITIMPMYQCWGSTMDAIQLAMHQEMYRGTDDQTPTISLKGDKGLRRAVPTASFWMSFLAKKYKT